MPLYEYECENKHRFEKRRPIQEADAPIECPDCESQEVTRKLSLFIALTKSDMGVQTLGSGGCGCGGACACGGGHLN